MAAAAELELLALCAGPAGAGGDWRDRALCAQTDPESFYPEKGGSTREAKDTCFRCEVREACLEEALEFDERFGIWGGLSERERRKLKRQLQARKPHSGISDTGRGSGTLAS